MVVSFEVFRDVASADDFGRWTESAIAMGAGVFKGEDRDAVRTHMQGDMVVLAIDQDESRVVGLSLLQMMAVHEFEERRRRSLTEFASDTGGVYLNGSVVHPDAQGAGIYRDLNRLRMAEVEDRRAPFVLTATQNPRVDRSLRSSFDEMVKSGRMSGYRLDRVMLPGLYGQLLNDFQADVEGTPYEQLDRTRGDAFSLAFLLAW